MPYCRACAVTCSRSSGVSTRRARNSPAPRILRRTRARENCSSVEPRTAAAALNSNMEMPMKNTLKLYEFPPTRSIRVRWTLQEMQLDFESILVNLPAREHHEAEFLKINPAAKIPVLIDDNLVLIESVAIVLYLADKYPEKGFTPASVADRGLMTQ